MDKTIRISQKTYKKLLKFKLKTGVSIKRLVDIAVNNLK